MDKATLLLMVMCMMLGCGRGIQGPAGLAGLNGAIGATGATGAQGDAGEDATPVTMVKLCPGTPSYPTTFVEYAFCINQSLYGTYSANGGFTTLLPPGRYTSNGINSRCDFTVSTGCVVSQ